MGLSRNKVAVSEGAAGSPPFYGEWATRRELRCAEFKRLICCSVLRDRKRKKGIEQEAGRALRSDSAPKIHFLGNRSGRGNPASISPPLTPNPQPLRIVGSDNTQGPPVPIPNTEVKLCGAEDT